MIKVINGTLEEEMPKLGVTLDAIFIDFPYGTTRAKWDTPINLEIFWENAWKLLKPNGVVICTAQVPFNIILGSSQLKHLKYEWIWEKTSATGHLNAKKMPMKAHENVMIFYKKLPTYNPQKTYGHKRKVASKESKAKCVDRGNQREDYIYNKESVDNLTGYDSTERYPRTVLKFASDKQKNSLHPTQKPESLVKYFLETYTNEGDIVGDFCAGSGTTGKVCQDINRNCILIEKEEKWVNVIKERLNV